MVCVSPLSRRCGDRSAEPDGWLRRRLGGRRGAPLALLLAVALAGCSAVAPRRELTEELASRGLGAEVAAPVQLEPQMRQWIREVLPLTTPPNERADILLRELIQRPRAPLRYRAGMTTGIREVWETGLANCLSFSHLFVAISRAAGVEAYYLRVRDLGRMDRDGDLIVVSDHVTAASGEGTYRRILDFSDRPARRHAQYEPLTDLRALALHYSNQGGEAIQLGENTRALELLALAGRIDPGLPDTWVNLGVARRRTGDVQGAEQAYRRALTSDPENASALHNLSIMLDGQGRVAESRAMLEAVSKKKLKSPWAALLLGRDALKAGRYEEAERLFRRATRLLVASGEAWAALGELSLARGDRAAARRFATKALRLDPGLESATALLARLDAG